MLQHVGLHFSESTIYRTEIHETSALNLSILPLVCPSISGVRKYTIGRVSLQQLLEWHSISSALLCAIINHTSMIYTPSWRRREWILVFLTYNYVIIMNEGFCLRACSGISFWTNSGGTRLNSTNPQRKRNDNQSGWESPLVTEFIQKWANKVKKNVKMDKKGKTMIKRLKE